MAEVPDLIDFSVIEPHKENIQSLPSGRSAAQLSQFCEPLSARPSPCLSQSAELKKTIKKNFEQELELIDEADDPLDVFNRYIKWTTDAYPSAQNTAESHLLPLIERATKTFLTDDRYRNDPRYLHIWLLYIKLFSDSPRETYAFLSKHGVGAGLALFYEEFAAWLERQGRWTQAEEVYCAGIDKEAKPKARIIRKYAEFQARRDASAQASDGPSSPALPRIRPALMEKRESDDPVEHDPQAADRAAAQLAAARKPAKSKLAVFADDSGPAAASDSNDKTPGWESIGSIADRKKENTHAPKPWAGEKLDGGKKMTGPKMMVFKDPTLRLADKENPMPSRKSKPRPRNVAKNPVTGRYESIVTDVESCYPDGMGGSNNTGAIEFSIEELLARHRGWLDKNFIPTPSAKAEEPQIDITESEATCHLTLPKQEPPKTESPKTKKTAPLIDLSDENQPPHSQPVTVPLRDENAPRPAGKKPRREDKDNRTRKIKVMQVEVKAETQTIQLKDSPSKPTKVRRKKAEPTMTICTKEAMNEVYEMFNQPHEQAAQPAEEEHESESDEDEYTSCGESTGTGVISGGASEFGDETTGDFTMSSSKFDDDDDDDDDVESTILQSTTTGSVFSDHLIEDDEEEGDEGDEEFSEVLVPGGTDITENNTNPGSPQAFNGLNEAGATPTSPQDSENYFLTQENSEYGDVTNELPYRATKASRRLPFMTPIVEKTESSLGAITAGPEKSFQSVKTPSRQNNIAPIPDVSDDESELLSSPFQDSPEDKENINGKIPQPALQKLAVRPKMALQESQSQPTCVEKGIRERKGPIILDTQCNPLDEAIRKTILTQSFPPLDTYTGYHNHAGTKAKHGAKVRKFAKTVSQAPSSVCQEDAPVLDFPDTHRSYTIRRELGRGAFAPVYLADSVPKDSEAEQHDFGIPRATQEVIKMEEPPSPWEFYVLRQAQRRLGVTRPSVSVVDAHEMHLYDDEGYLIEEYRSQGTLLDAINYARAENGGTMDEMMAMFFAVELMRTVEALHSKGIIHGDLKPDNVLLRFDGTDASWCGAYSRDGAGGWSEKGILLIDFGRGMDMKAFKPEVQFIADWATSEGDCPEMREMRPWTFQVDYYGLAGILHSLLFGQYMKTVAERGGLPGAGATKRYRISEGLKRYWQTDIWKQCFEVLLNPLMHVEGEEGNKMPLSKGLQQLRSTMEEYLESHSEKGQGLKGMLRRLEMSMKEKRRC